MTTPAFDQPAHARAMRSQGLWLDQTIDDYLVAYALPRKYLESVK